MREDSQDVIAEPSFEEYGTCDECGKRNTGVKIGQNKDGEWAELQFEHLDYDKISEEHVDQVIADLGVCCACGERLEPMERWAAEKMLRQMPQAVLDPDYSLSATCSSCASLGICPHCADNCSDDH